MLKHKTWKAKLTVNTGQVLFSGEIYYYWPQIQLTKSSTNAVAVMYSRNIPMAEKQIVSGKIEISEHSTLSV